MHESLIQKFTEKTGVIGIVGLGYVGLPLALRFAESGSRVIGFDIDEDKVARLAKGSSHIEHIDSSRIERMLSGTSQFTTDFSAAEQCDALIVCVPTPLTKNRDPDLSFVMRTIDSLAHHFREGQVLVLESTTYPGTTEEELLPKVQVSGFSIGENFYLVYSPEREDPGNKDFDTKSIPKIVGGVTKACTSVGLALYGGVIDTVVPVSSAATAEMTKLLENIHRAVNIGLVNEMKIVADRMGIDIFEVIDAAKTKPFGFTPYYPGPGLGGHCIPIDPFYLTWKAREFGLHTRFIELAGEINQAMPEYVISKLVDRLNESRIPLNGAKVLVLGIAYKKNVDDMRESPAVELMEILRSKGAEVSYSDPHVPVFPRMRAHSFVLSSVELSEAVIASFDAVLLATDHDKFDYQLIERSAAILVDTRGRFRRFGEHVIRA